MYVVKRPFKNLGKPFVAGDIIDDPAKIKRFKSKLAEGKILEVTAENEKSYAEYFKLKFGVDILRSEGKEAAKQTSTAKTEVTAKSAKPVAKATVSK